MRRILIISLSIAVAGMGAKGYAASCSCSDWMNKGGYCVDYVKEKIPAFPIPQNTTEIASLKNKEISEISEGDVAIFNFSNYWHVAYVEKVRRNQQGIASTINVSELNFGDQMSFDGFQTTWKSKSENEWKGPTVAVSRINTIKRVFKKMQHCNLIARTQSIQNR